MTFKVVTMIETRHSPTSWKLILRSSVNERRMTFPDRRSALLTDDLESVGVSLPFETH